MPRAFRGSIVLITIDTLRPDHMSVYGYRRDTTPSIAGRAKNAAVFTEGYTYWPKTRGSFVAMMTGKTAGESGYGPRAPSLHGFNATLGETLQKAGYVTAAFVDNANVASSLGFARGFSRYVETWTDPSLGDEVARTETITKGAEAFVAEKRSTPFFLWLHYVNPHAPYAAPPPFDSRYKERPSRDPVLPVTDGPFGGIWKQWARPGWNRLSDYVNAYDGEIAFVDTHVERVFQALDREALLATTTVLLTSDHGESFGEHDYYFDHGANLHDACQRVPLIVWSRGAKPSRPGVLASTLDVMPTLLDAARVSYPSGLAGRSLLPFASGREESTRTELFGENDRGWSGAWDRRFKVVRRPGAGETVERAYDRATDPREELPHGALGVPATRLSRSLSSFVEVSERSRARTRAMLEGGGGGANRMSKEGCEQLRALGYIDEC
jgi:arylsulfatase A-like enzyme